jgi:hypothetical protein
MDVMRAYIEGQGDQATPPTFDAPGNIALVTLESGETEAFINGTQPQTFETLEPMSPLEP